MNNMPTGTYKQHLSYIFLRSYGVKPNKLKERPERSNYKLAKHTVNKLHNIHDETITVSKNVGENQ
jgi:hypothetical protein